jgi:hypothetical protein
MGAFAGMSAADAIWVNATENTAVIIACEHRRMMTPPETLVSRRILSAMFGKHGSCEEVSRIWGLVAIWSHRDKPLAAAKTCSEAMASGTHNAALGHVWTAPWQELSDVLQHWSGAVTCPAC